MEPVSIVALAKKVLDLLRYLRAGDRNGVLTQLAAWVLGFGVVEAWVHSDYGADFRFAGVALAHASVVTVVIAGVSLASGAGVVTDLLKALDGSQSAAIPQLLDGKVRTTATTVGPVTVNVPSKATAKKK